jgi:hypothetical protein
MNDTNQISPFDPLGNVGSFANRNCRLKGIHSQDQDVSPVVLQTA